MKKLLLGLALVASFAHAQPVPPLSWYTAPDQHLPAVNTRGGVSHRHAGNDAAAGIAIIGLGLGIWAAHEANERREMAIRQREMEMEIYRRRIESSPMSTVQRTYIPQCFMRQGYDQYGRLYQERVCL